MPRIADGEHPEADRYTGFESGPHQPGGCFPGDVLIVIGFAFDHGAKGHDPIEAAFGQAPDDER